MVLLPACYEQTNDFRDLRWRWIRAMHYASYAGSLDWPAEDERTQQAIEAFRLRPNGWQPHGPQHQNLFDVHAGVRLCRSPGINTWIREAWLLSGMCIADVAARTGEPVAAVDWYESLFFDVRDRLACEGAIEEVVIGPAPPPGPFRVRWLMRSLAYAAGPLMFQEYLPALQACAHPAGDSDESLLLGTPHGDALAQLLRMQGPAEVRAEFWLLRRQLRPSDTRPPSMASAAGLVIDERQDLVTPSLSGVPDAELSR